MMSSNKPTILTNNHPQELFESLSPLSYVPERDILDCTTCSYHENKGDTVNYMWPSVTGTFSVNDNVNDTCSNTNAHNHTSRREESLLRMKGDQSNDMNDSSDPFDNNSNFKNSSCISQSHFSKQKERKKEQKKGAAKHLVTTKNFPYKHLLRRQSVAWASKNTTSPSIWQHNDNEDEDRVKILEKLFIPQWQLEFMKEFYDQGSSCKSSDKYFEGISTNQDSENHDERDGRLGNQKDQSLQEEQREYGSFDLHGCSTTDMYPEQYYFIRPGKSPRIELSVAFEVFKEESKKLMAYMDYSDMSRSKVMSFEKEMGIDREKILRRFQSHQGER